MKTTTLTATTTLTLAATALTATAALATATLPPLHAADAPLKKPNIVILLADDLGYGDVTFTGCKDSRTPNLQRFADTSMRLDNFHVCPICSPTRAGLMTGRYPLRFGLMKAVIPPWSKFGMPTTEVILPQLLAPAGYDERHMDGKWHLGHSRLAFLPANRGFTEFYGCYNGALNYFTRDREGQTDWHRDTPGHVTTVKEPGYTTDLLTTDAINFISKDHAGKPWLLYLAFNAPHGPLNAKPDDLNKYANANIDIPDVPHKGKKGKSPNKANVENDRKHYLAIIDNLDQNVGKILAAIDKLPDAANTLVLFFSDNGGLLPYSRNIPYREGKFSVYEGGIHVAAAIRWPAAGLVGGKASNALVGYIDIVPTLMTAAGLDPKTAPNKLDGIDILPILQGKTPAPKRPWFSYFDQSHNPGASVIEGDWKLVAHEGDVLAPGKTANTTYELYNIASDPSEKTDVLKAHPDIVKELKTRLTAFGRTAAAEEESVGTRSDGEAGFKAPKDWVITEP